MKSPDSPLQIKAILLQAGLIATLPALAPLAHAEETTRLEGVQVLGEKMQRTEQETITGNTVMTDQDIEKKNAKTLLEIVQQTPNVTVGGFGGIANIRGADGNGGGKSSLAWRGATRARTSTVVDGVNQIWTGGNMLNNDLWDVEQVEVLRGPQSTVQGRSAAGGAIVMKTKDPSFEQEAAVRLGAQQANGKAMRQIAGMVSGPVNDALAYRLSGNFTQGDHFIKHIDDDPAYDYNRDPDELEQQDIKAKLLWLPEEIPELAVRFDYQHQSQKGPYINQVELGDDGDYKAPMSVVNHRIGNTTLDSFATKLDYELDDRRSINFIASYSNFDSGYYHNQSASSFKMDSWDQNNISLEGRLNYRSLDGNFKGMLGTSYIEDDRKLYIYRVASGAALFDGTTNNQTLSLFGEGEYAVTDKTDFIFGGRIEKERQDRSLSSTAASSRKEMDETFLLPKIGARYTIDQDHTLGVDLRKGYTPGGIGMDVDSSNIYEYETEYVTALELSSKNRFWEQRATLNLNLFYNRYEDYQAAVGRALDNVDLATTYGLELESRIQLSRKTELYANASLLRTKVDEFKDNTAWEGNELPFSADKTIGFGINHAFSGHFNAGANVKYVGEYYVDLDNTSGAATGQDKAGDYTLVNINAAYQIGKSTTLKGYVSNLFDEYAVNYYFVGTNTQDVLPPRTLGLTLDHKF
ncbi:TonB-dependent receptor [Thiomicrorhabdus sp.]|uniref:TonB-dependent receptor n=1 Tax=Thiomicrorhabdus sp. TaxID=2039724 RepID=UPI0029C8E205|nr:TonB-dependent receptor [Thiomicrorhabdus sp.]